MNFLLFSFGAPFFLAMAVLIESQLSNVTFKRPTTMIFYVSLMNAVFLPLVLFWGTPTLPSMQIFACYMVLAIISVSYLYPYYLALKVIDASIVAALFSLGQVTIPIMSYFWLGERLGLDKYIGFTVIVLASVALSVKGNKVPKLHKSFYYMLFAAIITSFADVLEKYVLNQDDNWVNLIFYSCIISGLLPFSFLFVSSWRKDILKNFPPYKKHFKLFSINELICFLGSVCGVYALSGLSPVVTTSIAATQPMFMLAMSFILFKRFGIPLNEKISPPQMMKKMFCFILIILGVVLVVS